METTIKSRNLDQILSWWKRQTDGKFDLPHYLEVCRVRAIVINQELLNESINTENK
jgi:hypothetical protein